MRRINNSSPPFQLLLLCTASTGEEMRFFSPTFPNSFYNQIHSTVASGSAACSRASTRRHNVWAAHVKARPGGSGRMFWLHRIKHTHTHKQSKNRKMTQPFVHTHLKPESAKINLSDPFIPVSLCKTAALASLFTISPLLLHHLNPSRKPFFAPLSSVICRPGPTFGGAGVPPTANAPLAAATSF